MNIRLDPTGPDSDPLAAVIANEELQRRPARTPDHAAENAAIHRVVAAMAESCEAGLRMLAEAAASLTGASSGGVSLLTRDGGEALFRWAAVAGHLEPYIGLTMSRNSPCGAVLDLDCPVLMQRPERVWPAAAALDPPVVELLTQPLYQDGLPAGTLWVVADDASHVFDAEDVRLLGSLGRLAALAYQLRCVADNAQILNRAIAAP